MKTELQQLIAALPLGVAHAGRMGLTLAPETPPTLRQELLARLTHLSRASTGERHTLTAWLGDLLASAPRLRRGQISAYAIAAGLDAGTLSNAKLVCSRIPVSRRHEGLSWSHHCEVALAFSNPVAIEDWLALAETEKLSVAELRRSIRRQGATSRQPTNLPESATFAFMRELRAAARLCQRTKYIWQRWPARGRRLGVEELRPLEEFIDHMRGRSARIPARLRLPSPPRDISVN
jgi:hypothetical protein